MLFIGAIDWFMPTMPTLNGGRESSFRLLSLLIVETSCGSTRS
jgi:hypothetical protein